jgi:hypothetical protein
MTSDDATAMLIGALATAAVRGAMWLADRWRHRRTLRAASGPPLPRPLFGCFCDECEAASLGLRLASEQAAAPDPLPEHTGGYRTNPRPQPSLPRKTPWWRLALWWARGGPRRLEGARRRRDPLREYIRQIERISSKVDDLRDRVVRLYNECDGESVEVAVSDVRLEGAFMRVYDHDGESVLLDWEAHHPIGATDDRPIREAMDGERCAPWRPQ